MAASTPCLRTGRRVISQTSSGSKQASSILWLARRARYSGSERPAWRMNHTGVRLGVRAGGGGEKRRLSAGHDGCSSSPMVPCVRRSARLRTGETRWV